jgi:hypothetical protein
MRMVKVKHHQNRVKSIKTYVCTVKLQDGTQTTIDQPANDMLEAKELIRKNPNVKTLVDCKLQK